MGVIENKNKRKKRLLDKRLCADKVLFEQRRLKNEKPLKEKERLTKEKWLVNTSRARYLSDAYHTLGFP
jgi:hypothetical protein